MHINHRDHTMKIALKKIRVGILRGIKSRCEWVLDMSANSQHIAHTAEIKYFKKYLYTNTRIVLVTALSINFHRNSLTISGFILIEYLEFIMSYKETLQTTQLLYLIDTHRTSEVHLYLWVKR